MPLLDDCHLCLNCGLLPHPTVGASSAIGVDVLRVSEFGLGVNGFVESALAYFVDDNRFPKKLKTQVFLRERVLLAEQIHYDACCLGVPFSCQGSLRYNQQQICILLGK